MVNFDTLITFRKHLFNRTMGSSVFGRFHRLSESLDGRYNPEENGDEYLIDPHVMSEEEIMHKYWKISVISLNRIEIFFSNE